VYPHPGFSFANLTSISIQPDGRAWTTGPAFGCAVVFLGNQVAIPAQDSVRRQQAGDLLEPFPAKHLAARCEPSALIICEPQPAAMHLLAQDSILFFQIVDHLDLLPVDPTAKEQQQGTATVDQACRAIAGCHNAGVTTKFISTSTSQGIHIAIVSLDRISAQDGEGKGVEPDVKAPADQALEVARKLAREAIAKRQPPPPMRQPPAPAKK
jgi:hypothetical protein